MSSLSFIDVFQLNNHYVDSISKETNTLSNLDDNILIETLNKNWRLAVDRSNNREGKKKVNVIYNRIKYFSSKVERNKSQVEGFYSIEYDKGHYFTSFNSVSKFLFSNNLKPKFKVIGGKEK